MKGIILILSLFVFSSVNAQISTPIKLAKPTTVGRIAPLGAFIAELSYTVTESDTLYSFIFSDKKYTKIEVKKMVLFSGADGTAEQFYTLLKSVFLPENKDNKDYLITFKLGKADVTASNYKTFGVTTAMILVDGAHTILTEKQINKLFGK